MAIDSAAKRFSMLGFGTDDFGVRPSGSVDSATRATLLDLYEGIALGELAVADPIYCNYYAFMSDADVAVLGAVSAADYPLFGLVEDFYVVYGFMRDSDVIVTADVSDNDVVIAGTVEC